jgi:hypothetical protein
MRRRLRVLTEASFDSMKVAAPCKATWSEMAGDERVRYCGECRHSVYDLASMTRAEAITLISANEGTRTCVRLFRRADGTVLTQDCWTRLRAAKQRGWIPFAAALVIVAFTQLGLRGTALASLIQREQGRIAAEEQKPGAEPKPKPKPKPKKAKAKRKSPPPADETIGLVLEQPF